MNKQKKFTILIDVDAAAISKKSGIGYYTAGLTEAMAKNAPDNVRIVGHYFDFMGLNKPKLPKHRNISYRRSILVPRRFANLLRRLRIALPYELLTRTRADFIVYPNFLRRHTLFKTPYAAAIHDLAYIDTPQYVSTRNRRDLLRLVPWTIQRASFLLAISQTMKGRITHEFPWYRGDFVCEPLPIAMPLRDNLPAQNEMGITGKYVLFLGNIEPRKNIVRLVRAYENLPVTLRNKYSLVLAGGVGWNNDEIAKTIENSVASGHKVITTGYVSEKQRASLYKNASVFAFPSLYEGYGLPVLEAASYGVPVVASDLSVLREVMGQGAAYCDPMKTSSITETLRAVLESKAVRARLVDGGSAAVSDKSWDRVAKSIYKRIGYSI